MQLLFQERIPRPRGNVEWDLARPEGVSVVGMSVGIEPLSESPGCLASEVDKPPGLTGTVGSGVSAGVGESMLCEVVMKRSTNADAVIGDPADVDVVDAGKSRCFFRC